MLIHQKRMYQQIFTSGRKTGAFYNVFWFYFFPVFYMRIFDICFLPGKPPVKPLIFDLPGTKICIVYPDPLYIFKRNVTMYRIGISIYKPAATRAVKASWQPLPQPFPHHAFPVQPILPQGLPSSPSSFPHEQPSVQPSAFP